MKIYKVGGCVRDKLLGIIAHDNDYLVIGSTPQQMLDLGFKQVGKTFPVFLHPKTKEEYALARKEIKIGKKHSDFLFVFTPDITLEEDLQRRDFTCNALAEDVETGEIYDYVGGKKDITQKTLRHVNTEHFAEDPLRVLRMCRFSAQLNFNIFPTTMNLASAMVKNNMLAHLSRERIWEEFYKALNCTGFYRFVEASVQCGAMQKLLPEISLFYSNSSNIKLLQSKTSDNALNPKIRLAVFWLLSNLNYRKECTKKIYAPKEYSELITNYQKYTSLFLNETAQTEELYELTLDVTRFINTSRLQELFQTIRLLNTDNKIINQNFKRCLRIFTICQSLKATDMPNFNSLPKDKNFGIAYRKFILEKISGF